MSQYLHKSPKINFNVLAVFVEDRGQVFKLLNNIIVQLGEELRWPKHRFAAINTMTSLDRDLGLDSLSRVELASRVEREFGVTLGENLFLKIDTIDELAQLIVSRTSHGDAIAGSKISSSVNLSSDTNEIKIPSNAATLVEVLEFHCHQAPDRQHIVLLESSTEARRISYQDLYQKSMMAASVYMKKGIKKGDAIGIMLPTSEAYFYSFFGAILAGAVPVAIYPPVRPSQLLDHLVRHSAILENSNAKILVTDKGAIGKIGRLFQTGLRNLEILNYTKDMQEMVSGHSLPAINQSDTAFIQYTSGSTGAPKGVVINHGNILANIRAMGEVLEASPKDVFVSWLPLYHDMGLIGAWLGSFYFGCPLVVMSPISFLSRPKFWLETIQNFRGTITAAPNFAFELCVKHIPETESQKIDLRSLRVICNGAEPVNAKTVMRFNDRFKRSGLNQKALLPVYGLAECTVGLAFPRLNSGAIVENISREIFEKYSRAQKISATDKDAVEIVSCGQALPGHEIRIVDGTGYEAQERHEGQIQFRGPSATTGYLNNEIQTRKLFDGSWLVSGDLGYMAGGQVFVTGRIKDLIKIAGRNIHPEEIETTVGDIPGIRKGCVAVFGFNDPKAGTDRLIIVAETREVDESQRNSISKAIQSAVLDQFSVVVWDVRLVMPHTLLKTSSGKLRRSACKQMFHDGILDVKPRQAWVSIFWFSFSSSAKKMMSQLYRLIAIVRSGGVWFGIVLLVLVFWPFYVFLPHLRHRWLVCRIVGKLSLALAGVKLKIIGDQPREAAIYVVNHSSYSDIVYLLAALKFPVSFVAKAELRKWIPVKFTLDRLQVIYVDRYEFTSSLRDAAQITTLAKEGRSLLTFPEGTFQRSPGLLPFHIGAFCAAADSGLPIVPIAIHGARSILNPDTWLIRPGLVTLKIHDIIDLSEVKADMDLDRWRTSLSLQKKARDIILETTGEPDLQA